MMKRLFSLFISSALVACDAASDRASLDAQVEADAVLATLGGERVVHDRSGDRMIWTSATGVRWTSRSLYGARPSVGLRYVNSDTMPDLFWTVMHEDLIGGQLLIAVGDSARSVFVTAEDERCRVPEINDVTGDGIVDILTYPAYAIPLNECYGDALAESCVVEYPTEWTRVLVQRGEEFVENGPDTSGFYENLEGEYTTAATRLEEAVRAGTAPARCDSEVVAALRDLAARARAISRRAPS